ncbi:MAG: hypothetical protein JKX81_15205 [Arenicella sp.]|nr:hypothetical protein [Arenicella sp.]
MTELIVIVIAVLATSMVARGYTPVALLGGRIFCSANTFDFIWYSLSEWSMTTHHDVRHIVSRFLNRPSRYQIKHIFLIDRESGIQIEEVSSKEGGMLDGDAISAMFSAIQSFVQDAFSRDHSSKLTDFRVGDYSIWVAHGPRLMLACVMVGDVPKALKNELDHTLQTIQDEFVESLSALGQQNRVEGIAKVMKTLMIVENPTILARKT